MKSTGSAHTPATKRTTVTVTLGTFSETTVSLTYTVEGTVWDTTRGAAGFVSLRPDTVHLKQGGDPYHEIAL